MEMETGSEMEMRETTTKARWAISCWLVLGVLAWRTPRRVLSEQGSLYRRRRGTVLCYCTIHQYPNKNTIFDSAVASAVLFSQQLVTALVFIAGRTTIDLPPLCQ